MVAFSAIKIGDTLFACRRQKMGNTKMSTLRVWHVAVKEIDTKGRRALVSWNGNEAKWWGESKLRSLRRTPPKTRQSVTGAIVRA